MEFIEHCIRVIFNLIRTCIHAPALRICSGQINDHGTISVYTGGSGIWITGFCFFSIIGHKIGIVGTIQIAVYGNGPYALFFFGHMDLIHQVIGTCGTGFI